MISRQQIIQITEQLLSNIHRHCEAKGYSEGPGINSFLPHNCLAAFGMTKALIDAGLFDHFVAVAPGGHIYGYFFEALGAKVLSCHVDYPPTKFDSVDDLSIVKGGHVLIIVDDVSSKKTLELVVQSLVQYSPEFLSLYLGHRKSIQIREDVPSQIAGVFVAGDFLSLNDIELLESEFLEFFKNHGDNVDG